MKKMSAINTSGQHAAAGTTRAKATLLRDFVKRLEAVFRRGDGYHPERHYMRGPGPKWRQCHPDSDDAQAGCADDAR